MAVPLVPSAPLARLALLGGYGSYGAAMGRFIPPIRELPANPPPCSLTGRRSMRRGSGMGTRDPPEDLVVSVAWILAVTAISLAAAPFVAREILIDSCLDSGGRWSAALIECEP
jgi:hypothetical protein